MNGKKTLNLFYEEPDPDRWFKFDRYPRKLIRRLFRGKPQPGGVMSVALQLMKGLDKLDIPYRFNDYKYARNHPSELIGVIGKPHLIFEKKFKNPILFGAGIFSHPIECPDLFEKYPQIKKILVPGKWMQNMFEPFYPSKVIVWPVGIDTGRWSDNIKREKQYDFLIYDKILWKHEEFYVSLIQPIIKILKAKNLTYSVIKYGSYNQGELLAAISVSSAAIFLCGHETQGQAYQQILSTNTPILAWDRGGFWQDPYYFPEKVKYQPVSAVPYWDERCGEKFKSIVDFESVLVKFNKAFENKIYEPRAYIMENLTLEICAQKYVVIYKRTENEI